MGILTAMNSAVGGLGAQSFALENISGNIANSSTTGFKRKDTSFADLVRSNTTNAGRVTSGGVTATSRSTITLDGDIQGSKVDTHLAINGTGFFCVSSDPLDGALGARYTRAGDFEQYYDARNGQTYLRNGSGYSLMGQSIDQATGSPIGNKKVITIDKTSQSAKSTEKMTYKLNLPTVPVTKTNAAVFVPASATTTIPGGTVSKAEADNFMDNSIAGGSVTIYDAQGTPSVVQLRWAKFSEASTGRSEWGLFYRQAENPAAATDPAWQQIKTSAAKDTTSTPNSVLASGAFFFDNKGKQLDDTSAVNLGTLTIEGKAFPGVTLNLAATEYADKNGQATTNQLTQDGYATGEFEGVSVDDNSGIVSYNYSNGQTVKTWSIPIVAFNGASYLKAEDGGAYTETIQSGGPIDIDGALSSSALEASNVDISEEFTKLIVTQQAFSANSKVITTADQMMTDILQIIR
jgi:flagellar hook protein FlgE